MTPNLTRYINKSVYVSLPTLFEDGMCRAFTLLGVEITGLWLQSDELTKRLVPEHMSNLASLAPVVFIPFAHIAGVLVATIPPAPAAATPAQPVQEHSAEPKAKRNLRK